MGEPIREVLDAVRARAAKVKDNDAAQAIHMLAYVLDHVLTMLERDRQVTVVVKQEREAGGDE